MLRLLPLHLHTYTLFPSSHSKTDRFTIIFHPDVEQRLFTIVFPWFLRGLRNARASCGPLLSQCSPIVEIRVAALLILQPNCTRHTTPHCEESRLARVLQTRCLFILRWCITAWTKHFRIAAFASHQMRATTVYIHHSPAFLNWYTRNWKKAAWMAPWRFRLHRLGWISKHKSRL